MKIKTSIAALIGAVFTAAYGSWLLIEGKAGEALVFFLLLPVFMFLAVMARRKERERDQG